MATKIETPAAEIIAPDLLAALKDLLGDRGNIHDGECHHCGRDYREDNEIKDGDWCPDDDCPSFGARAAIANAEAHQ